MNKVKINDSWLTIANYKEPLKAIPKKEGFGYYGTMLHTPDGEYVMCNVCAKLCSNLGAHIRNSHKELGVKGYREKYQLARTTALVSEKERQALKQRMMDYLKTLTKEQMDARRANARLALYKRSTRQPKMSLETKNKRGVCPDQLLAKIEEVAQKLGRVPSLKMFMKETGGQRYKHLIYKTFGSWNKALDALGMEHNSPITTNGGRTRTYSDEYLLELLVLYTQENGKIPTTSDCKAGKLPGWDVYKGRFGSFEEARQIAGVYQLIEKHGK